MPIVGNQKFPYSAAGQMAAQQASKRTGKPLKVAPGASAGAGAGAAMGKGFAPPPPTMPMMPVGRKPKKAGK